MKWYHEYHFKKQVKERTVNFKKYESGYNHVLTAFIFSLFQERWKCLPFSHYLLKIVKKKMVSVIFSWLTSHLLYVHFPFHWTCIDSLCLDPHFFPFDWTCIVPLLLGLYFVLLLFDPYFPSLLLCVYFIPFIGSVVFPLIGSLMFPFNWIRSFPFEWSCIFPFEWVCNFPLDLNCNFPLIGSVVFPLMDL